jgi:serine/threonine protein kinase
MLVLRSVRTDRIFRFDKDAEDAKSGGEGIVFSTETGRVAKVYHDDEQTPRRADKLATMLENPPSPQSRGEEKAPIVAWPVDLLEQTSGPRKGTVVGYLMPSVEGAELLKIYHRGARRKQFPLVGYDYLLRCAASVAEAVASLHRDGYVVGDINESNFLVSGDGDITAIDADSFQVPNPARGTVHHCTVGKPEYLPPELAGKDLSAVERTAEHDHYSLAVLIFQILMGCHPTDARYTGLGDPSDKYVFPYEKPKASYKPNYRPPKAALDFQILPEPLRALFKQCFRAGLTSPSERPTAEEWALALRSTEEDLTTCLWNSQHKYSPHLDKLGGYLKQCPWCKRRRGRPDGRDPFPSRFSVGTQRADRKEKAGFLKVKMPGKHEWMGAMGTVGTLLGYGDKYVFQTDENSTSTNESDANDSEVRQYSHRRKHLRMGVLALVVLIPLAWAISSLADTEQPPLEYSEQETEKANTTNYAVEIDAERLNVRRGPSTSNDVLATVEEGEQYRVLDTDGDWQRVRVRTEDGRQRTGWIYSDHTKRADGPTDNQQSLPLGDERSAGTSGGERTEDADGTSNTDENPDREDPKIENPLKELAESRATSADEEQEEASSSGEPTTESDDAPQRPEGETTPSPSSDAPEEDAPEEDAPEEEEPNEALARRSFRSGASAEATLDDNHFTMTLLSGTATETRGGGTKLTLDVRQTSENFNGDWVRWGHILKESYLDGPRGRAYDVDQAASDNLGAGRVRPGDSRSGTVAFRLDAPPSELQGRMALNFTYFPYRGGRSVRLPFSIE